MTKVALITGVTGQDGAYLAEFLLGKGYEVHGVKRRASLFNTERIDHLYQDPHVDHRRFILHYGDLTDSTNLIRIVQQVRPDEIYNLAAQSHVQVSFETPEYTADADGLGTLRLLEAIRILGLTDKTRFYQASTSELFGKVLETPQRETTPFYPRSPYAVAKLYAYWITVNYREAYGMYACNGILFNHECVTTDTPLLIRSHGKFIDVVSPDELIALRNKGTIVQRFDLPGIEIWDGQAWTGLRAITATKRRRDDPQHDLLAVQARGGIAQVTAHHHMLTADAEELSAGAVVEGQSLLMAKAYPETPGWTRVVPELAELLGLLTADGYISLELPRAQFTNNNAALRERVAELWSRVFMGNNRQSIGSSGFSEAEVGQLYLSGAGDTTRWLRKQLYTERGYKRVPPLILNAEPEIQAIYLKGYYAGDGLKAGNGDSVKTNSALLAQGLCYLYAQQDRVASVYLETRNGKSYYQVNLSSANPLGGKGQHLRKPSAEVRRIRQAYPEDDTWVFDLETESGHFMGGVGRLVMHNSPLRGETFVTRKITRGLARIKAGMQERLHLGNLDARRDWGHARDYIEMQWLMLQQPAPDDYVIATGVQHTVREFVETAAEFLEMRLEWRGHGVEEKGYDADTGRCVVEIDPRYFRPAEVETLLGDPTKAREKLGWTPRTPYRQLVEEMVREDRKAAERDALCRREGYAIPERSEE